MGNPRKPVRDKQTGAKYPSQYNAGLHLYKLVNGDPNDTYVWFKIVRAFPDRFENFVDGEWVDVDYSGPSGRGASLRAIAEDGPSRVATLTRTTTIEIDEAKLADVKEVLGTQTLRETVDRSFDEVLARAARERSIERLRKMDGLDLDKPKVMEGAWR